MEAIVNAVGLTPLSVLSDRKQREPRKFLAPQVSPSLKNPIFAHFSNSPSSFRDEASRRIRGGLVFLSSVLGSGLAKALTYEEALQQSTSSFSSGVDASNIVDSVTNFAAENPLIVGGGVAVLAVPLIVSQILGAPRAWGEESAKSAYAKLADDSNAQLLDIRPAAELRKVGGPDIRGLKKKPVQVVYKGEDKVGFLNKLSLKFKEPENTTLYILDKFDGNSELVAELVTANGYKAAYAIKDGAEGPRGWLNSGLPWVVSKNPLSLDLSSLTDGIGETSDAATVALGLAAATGLGLLAFTEAETILQLLGSAAIIQVLSKKLLFAEDRKQTLKQVDEFLTTKIAPKELVDEITQIGKALLPSSADSKALPAPTESSAPVAEGTVEKAESVAQANDAPPEAEVAPEPISQINSVPKAEAPSSSSKPLSPYPNYPDYKPPTSPIPSQP